MSGARAIAACVVVALGAASAGCGPKDHAKAGYQALREGRNDLAIDELRAALAEDEAQPDVHYDLGIAYENVGWADKALPEFNRAIALDPNNEEFRAGLAETKRTLGYNASQQHKDPEAVRLFQETLMLAPNDATTWYNLAKTLKRLARDDEAKRAMARAIELDPKHYAGKDKTL